MSIDLKKSFCSVAVEKPIATGQTVNTEGAVLVRVVESGVEKVQVASGGAGEVLVGFAMYNAEQPATQTAIEDVVVPSTGPYTIQLAHPLLVGTAPTVEARVYDLTVGAAISTQVATSGAVANTNQWHIDPTTGVLTVFSARAGNSLRVFYRFNLTVMQSQQLFFQPNVNNSASNYLGLIGVMMGKGQVFTNWYDMSVDWSAANPAVYTAAGGKVTVSGAGTDISAKVRVIKAPSAEDMSLGLEFNI